MVGTFPAFVNSHSVKSLEFQNILSVPYLCLVQEIKKNDFVVFLLISLLFKLVHNKLSLNVEYIYITER